MRFEVVNSFIFDSETKGNYYVESDANREFLCDLLNELHTQVKSQMIVIKGYQERNEKLFNENKQLKNRVEFFKGLADKVY